MLIGRGTFFLSVFPHSNLRTHAHAQQNNDCTAENHMILPSTQATFKLFTCIHAHPHMHAHTWLHGLVCSSRNWITLQVANLGFRELCWKHMPLSAHTDRLGAGPQPTFTSLVHWLRQHSHVHGFANRNTQLHFFVVWSPQDKCGTGHNVAARCDASDKQGGTFARTHLHTRPHSTCMRKHGLCIVWLVVIAL